MIRRLWTLLRPRAPDHALDAELRYHIDRLEAEHRERGLPAESARLAARRDLGGVLRTREEYRDQRGLPMLETLWRDVRFSLRSMQRTPAVTLAVILTLAIGIGANTAIFTVVNAVLIKPLPYPDPDRLVTVSHAAPGVRVADVSSAPFLYFTEREQSRVFEGVGLLGFGTATVTGQGEPELVRRAFITFDVLQVLGIGPRLGRYFSQDEDAPGALNNLVITYDFWQRHFGGDASVVGQTIVMDAQPWTIIGVTPQRFRFLDRRVDVVSTLRLNRNATTLGNYFRPSLARLKPGVTIEQANADIQRLIPLAIESFPPAPGSTRDQVVRSGLAPNLRPLKQDVVGNVGVTLWVLMGTLGMMLLIACANIANLILARTEGRQQELAIRAALGAGWRRIARELFTESLLLSFAGGALGVALAAASVRLLLAIRPANLPRLDEITMDMTAALFTLGLSVLCGLLFGAVPVVRYAMPRAANSLNLAGRWASGSREKLRARGALVVVQVALALVLLVGAGLMIRTFQELNSVHPGFAAPHEVQTLQVQIPESRVRDMELTARRQQEILNRLQALPGVASAAYISDVPMGGGVSADLLLPEGKVFENGETPRSVQTRFISPGVFTTLQIPLVRGRDLTWNEIYEKRPVALISETLARLEWGSAEGALGKRLHGASAVDEWKEIIGVVGDVRERGLNQPVMPTVYFPVLGERVYNLPNTSGARLRLRSAVRGRDRRDFSMKSGRPYGPWTPICRW